MEYVVWTSEFNINRKDVSDNEINYFVTPRFLPSVCPACGSENLINYGSYSRRFRDMPQGSYDVFINVKTKRWQCRSCGHTFVPQYRSVSEKSRITNQLRQRIRNQFLYERTEDIAEQYHMPLVTVYRITREVLQELQPSLELPAYLGLAEVKMCSKTRLAVLDMKNESIVDILPDASRDTLAACLGSLEGGPVSHLFCGFRASYLKYPEDMYHPTVCLDMYYTAKEFHAAAEKEKAAHPECIADIYVAEREFLSLYDAFAPYRPNDLTEAITEIREELPEECTILRSFFSKLLSYRDELIAFMNSRTDHEYMTYITERIKRAEKANAGCSFETIRTKILLTNTN